uniref:Putative GDP-mannose 4,6-dehydratase n=1 Tax=viral metagenome TaxID=1070528 RepID=A0A6M3K3C4_9ZZZZ
MNVLVTGGAGFIGSHFIDRIIGKVDSLVCVDKLTYAGNMKNLTEASGKDFFKFYHQGIESMLIPTILDIHKIDCIVNFAAETHVDRSIQDPSAFLYSDILGTFNLAFHALKYKVKRFIHISTDEVYGPIEKGEATEEYPLKPTSPYSSSKACADLLLQSYQKTYGLPLIIVRPCNNYGPRQYPEKLIPITITRILQGKKAILHGEGKEVREWIYVEDCVRAIEKIMTDGKAGEIYNVGSGERCENRNIIANIVDVLHPGIDAVASGRWQEFMKQYPNRPGNDFRYAINCSKLGQLCGHSVQKLWTFHEGIRETIRWYKDNLDWWSDVNIEANIYKDGDGYLR